MGWRILTDENVEPATRNYLEKLGHDVENVVDVDELGESATDEEIAAYASRTKRLILTQDNDFFTELDVQEDTEGVIYQKDQELSAKQVGDIVQNISEQYSPDRIVLEYVGRNWL